jgi:hypothetical protein
LRLRRLRLAIIEIGFITKVALLVAGLDVRCQLGH